MQPSDKAALVLQKLFRLSPNLESNPVVFQAIQSYFHETALIATDLNDLDHLLQGDCLYRVLICRQPTMHQCVLELIDNHAEALGARGMLRFYRVPPQFQWQDCESAETELGNAFTLESYAWQPDAFTVFNDAILDQCELVCIMAFD